MHLNLRGGGVDFTEIVRREFDGKCPDVLFQPMQLGGAGDWNDPRFLGQQPCECDLSRRRVLPLGDASEKCDEGLIRLESLGCEPREVAAEVGTVKGRAFINLAREKAPAQRAVRHEANSKFLKGRYDFLLGSSRPERVFALQSCDRLDRVCSTDRLDSCLGKAKLLDLSLSNQFLHRTSDIFYRHARVYPMLIQQVDCLNLESLERSLDGLLDMLRSAIQAG